MQKIRVGIIRGGPSSEHEVSLETGKAMLKHLPEHYESVDVFIDKEGKWFVNDTPIEFNTLTDYIDVALNAMHGEYGEDGQVQRELDQFAVPYTGSGSASSAIAFNKELTKDIFQKNNIKVPIHVVLNKEEATNARLQEVFRTHPAPYVVKPVCAGSSVGVEIASTQQELIDAVQSVFTKGFNQVMIEEYIQGREGTCGVVENFRGEDLYALPPVEIIPPSHAKFFSADVKYTGETQEICPSNFAHEEKLHMQDAARYIHEALGLAHYSRSDFIVSPRGIYALEVNTLPGMTPESLLPKSLAAVGCTFSEFLNHLIKQAYRHA